MKPINIAILVLVLLLISIGAYAVVANRRSNMAVDGTTDYEEEDPQKLRNASEEAAYQQGVDDANALREKRERAALLTGGFSEVGRWLGIKPFG